ncbi:MAG: carboxylesterase family protein, partial [Gammaproteobacteria bacterium]
MATQTRDAAIVGIHEYPSRDVEGKVSPLQIKAESAARALEDAGLTWGDVDAIYDAGDGGGMGGLTIAEYFGLKPSIIDTTQVGGSSYEFHASHAKRGDVVVVTINHRLNVYGYLHLADIGGERFAGSGIAGMLDAVLALEWVRDNIEAFGGDPSNVTIFGESGGGSKVSTLLAMPSAKGLFHRAVVQSGPGLRGVEPSDATELAEQLLDKLGIAKNELDKLQAVPFAQLTEAVGSLGVAAGMMRLAPVVDGSYLPAHPFDPVAAPTAANVPLIIGSNKDESALFSATDKRRRRLTEEELLERLERMLGDRRDEILAVYKRTRPNDSPWDLYIAITSEATRLRSIQLAERKAAGSAAPVFMYLFTYESEYLGGLFKSCHALEIPFVFDNPDIAPFTGERPERY